MIVISAPRRKLRGLALGLCVLAVACTRGAERADSGVTTVDEAPAPMLAEQAQVRAGGSGMGASVAPMAAPPPAPPPPAPPPAPGTSAHVPVPTERKVIRNGTMHVEVERIDPALEALRAHVAAVGGYVAGESSSARSGGRARVASMTLRVPAARLDETVAKVRTLGQELSLTITAEDITEQYFDLEIRLRTQRDLETRLRQLLDRPSNRLTDLLEIEREVARVRGEIDQMEGRKRYWDNQVGFSTLTVNLVEPAPMVAGEQGGVWQTLERALGDAADNFVLTIAGIIAATGALVPLAVALLVAFFVLRAIWRRWRRVRA
jgi:hypothetical protein